MCIRWGAVFRCRGCGKAYLVVEPYDTQVYWERCEKAMGSLHRRPCYQAFGKTPASDYKRFEGDCTAPGRPCPRTRVEMFKPSPMPPPPPCVGQVQLRQIGTASLGKGAATPPSRSWLVSAFGWLTVGAARPPSVSGSLHGEAGEGTSSGSVGPRLPAGCLVLPDDDEEFISHL
ncbi:hypothetical protein MAPG_01267 [Magnaporthiopsis poae ATCC 64411]|uniref:Uncharacterized protein n=1 Tax=Magnaporthiopsis poae (strain ATCC 64411 / 73-15) TaxID=644358 RepID=A0A0C4DN88_MAGP6|nr:hypothetical protein MAPG_01267 [Magnaporthiopsis poae ATCC 64411]